MAIVNTKTQNEMDETFRLLYHKALKKIYNVIHSIRQDSENFSRKNLDSIPEPVINPAMGLAPASKSLQKFAMKISPEEDFQIPPLQCECFCTFWATAGLKQEQDTHREAV